MIEISKVKIKRIRIGNRSLQIEAEVGGEVVLFDVSEMMVKPEDIERVVEYEVYWEGIASAMRKSLADFEIEKERILSHWRKYVKWWLKGRGEKDTIEGRADGLYSLFSRDEEVSRRTGAVYAYKGYLEEQKQNVTLDMLNELFKWANDKNGDYRKYKIPEEFKNFYEEMIKYLKDDIYYDDLLKYEAEAKEVVEILEGISNAYRQKAVLLASLISGRKSLASLKEELYKELMSGIIDDKRNA